MSSSRSERVAILAPFGKDGTLLKRLLQRNEIAGEIYGSIKDLCESIQEGSLGVVLITEEALGAHQVELLENALSLQPKWSELTLLMMMGSGHTDATRQRRLGMFAPLKARMVLLERPLRMTTVLSSLESAIRARRRQYELRDLLEQERINRGHLETANLSLQHSNERLAEFAYAVSHDLQEPLRTVTAYTQLIQRRISAQLGPEAEQYIQFVVQGAAKMKSLINDLLQYSQAGSGLAPTDVHTNAMTVIEGVKESLRALIEETGSQLTMGELPVVCLDERQLTQLFQNLIENAIKYRSSSAPQISVTAKPEGAFWLFEVKDNGIGFDQAYAEQVFGLFKRLNNDSEGTGIGLALCRRIVEHYGGRIWAESIVGAGTAFRFLLPGCREIQPD